jgi:hypothetical protein
LGLWTRYHVVGADALAPRSGLNDLITLQKLVVRGRPEPPAFRFSGIADAQLLLTVLVLCAVADRCC